MSLIQAVVVFQSDMSVYLIYLDVPLANFSPFCPLTLSMQNIAGLIVHYLRS